MAKDNSTGGVTTYEVVKTLHQISSDAYDGCEHEIGLEREKGNPLLDSRVIDGFNIGFLGNVMRITYQKDCKISDFHDKGFENDIAHMFGEIEKFVKKEYKKHTQKVLSLKALKKEPEILGQSISNIRTYVQCYKDYEVGNLKSEKVGTTGKVDLDKMTKNFLKEFRRAR